MGVVQEAVEERGDRCGIAEELAPVIHRAVGRQERGRPLVAAIPSTKPIWMT